MKERPILFQGAMVRALLDGSKTQTRRIVKPQPIMYEPGQCVAVSDMINDSLICPYGQPGDQLYVRETFFAYGRWETRYSEKKKRDEWHFVDMTLECDRVYQYAADNPDVPLAKGRGGTPGWWTRPAIFMPRAASRILLEIVSVRVERLRVIGREDAIAEGVDWKACSARQTEASLRAQRLAHYIGLAAHYEAEIDYVGGYRHLWESINGVGSWAANPFVWRIEFKRVTP